MVVQSPRELVPELSQRRWSLELIRAVVTMDAAHTDLLAQVADVLLAAYFAEEHAGTRHAVLSLLPVVVILDHVVLEHFQIIARVSARCHEHC